MPRRGTFTTAKHQGTAIFLSLKSRLQRELKRLGLYYRLKASLTYDLYWKLADRSLIEDRNKELAFYRTVLRGFCPGDLIFDIGANSGTKTEVFLKLGAHIIACEPDGLNQEVLKQKFHEYRFTKKPVVIVGKAVSDTETVKTMWIDQPGSAKNTFSVKWVEHAA